MNTTTIPWIIITIIIANKYHLFFFCLQTVARVSHFSNCGDGISESLPSTQLHKMQIIFNNGEKTLAMDGKR